MIGYNEMFFFDNFDFDADLKTWMRNTTLFIDSMLSLFHS